MNKPIIIDGIPCKPLRDMDYDLQKVINQRDKYISVLEKIKTFAKPIKENTCFGMYCGFVDWTLDIINEVLKDE